MHCIFQICGSSDEACCGIVNIADFKSLQEGQVYDYTGDEGLEDCYRFPLDQVTEADDFKMTVYHEGSDGGQFDWIEVGTSDGAIIRCYLGDYFSKELSRNRNDMLFRKLDGRV